MSIGATKLVGDQGAIRPFCVKVPETDLAEMRRRIRATKWPEEETAGDESRGVQLATIRELARYWSTEYDWRRIEARLNSYPQSITEIDGLDIHFVHVRSKHDGALPLIITHGWPDSVVARLQLVEPLTDPAAHGGRASDAFHVVMPSMAGYGFSGKPTSAGWDCTRMARAWTVLMQRLGYSRFVAQGGDWGALVTEQMGVLAPRELLGIHVNLPSAVPADILEALASAKPPAGLSTAERKAFERLAAFFADGLSYAHQMARHPNAMYGISDSPVGLAAWFLDHDLWDRDLVSRAVDGRGGRPTRDDILDNLTLTWLTNTAISSARLYAENKLPFFTPTGVQVPVAVSAFPNEIYQVPRSWAERAYPRLMYYNMPDRGGHFAAWEQPGLFVEELRAGFRSLR